MYILQIVNWIDKYKLGLWRLCDEDDGGRIWIARMKIQKVDATVYTSGRAQRLTLAMNHAQKPNRRNILQRSKEQITPRLQALAMHRHLLHREKRKPLKM